MASAFSFAQHGNPLDKALANSSTEVPEPQPTLFRFNMQLRDVPGDEGFPLAFTPWLIQQGEEEPLFEGVTDDQGRISLTAEQEELLSKAAHSAAGNLWLSYPGQRIALSLHQEQDDRDMNELAMAALDYQRRTNSHQTSNLLHERCTQDSPCDGDGDIYAHLQSRE